MATIDISVWDGNGYVSIIGAKWYSGSGAPATSLGKVDDWYLNTTTGAAYKKTDASTWTLQGNLTGPTGPTGATGSTGATGAVGPEGPVGPSGVVAQTSAPVDTSLLWIDTDDNGYGAVLPSRQTVTYTTASLADLAEETGTVVLAKGYRILRVSCDKACRVRLYTTAAKRTADAARPVGTDPTGDHGLMMEFVAVTGLLAADLSPTADGWQGESTPSNAVPIAVQNTSGSAGTVAVTLTFIQTEA